MVIRSFKISFLLIWIMAASFFCSLPAANAIDNIEEFARWDNEFNLQKYKRTNGFQIQQARYFEIEADQLLRYINKNIQSQSVKDWSGLRETVGHFTMDSSEYLSPEVRESFFFRKKGKDYFRLFIHPGDTKYYKILSEKLSQKGIAFLIKNDSRFETIKLASRSFIVINKKNGISFSVKTQTSEKSVLHGKEYYSLVEAFLSRRISDYFWSQKNKLEYLDIAYEGLAFYSLFDDFEFNQSVRLMDEVARNHRKTFSGFVYMNHKEARRIAKRSGVSFKDYWQNAMYIKGRAMSELAMVLGWNLMASSHSQNFRWVTDNNYRVIGVTVLDLADGAPNEKIVLENGGHDLLEILNLNFNSTRQASDRILIPSFLPKATMGDFSGNYLNGVKEGLKNSIFQHTENYDFFTPQVTLVKVRSCAFLFY